MAVERLLNTALVGLSIKTGRCLVKPVHVYWIMSTSCNFQCMICALHNKRHAVKNMDLISLPEIKNVIDELKEWGVIQFGIGGGEPLLDLSKLMETLRYANDRGLYTHFVTNGFLLTREVINHYDKIGGGYITISIDGLAKTHDTLRRKKGSFSRCIEALELVKSLKPKRVAIKITTVLSNSNLDEIVNVVSIAKRFNAPIFIQPYRPPPSELKTILELINNKQSHPLWITRENYNKLNHVVDRLIKIKKKNPSLIINPYQHLRKIPVYFKDPLKKSEAMCRNGYTNLLIRPDGNVRFCQLGSGANIKNQGLKSIWYSEAFEATRRESLQCRRICLFGCRTHFNLLDLIRLGLRLCRQ